MKKILLIIAACVVGSLVMAQSGVIEIKPGVERIKTKTAIKQMKTAAAWQAMTNQLAQYESHYTEATNAVSKVTDAKTQTALTKSLRATDDCHDALVKLIKCFQDYVKANE